MFKLPMIWLMGLILTCELSFLHLERKSIDQLKKLFLVGKTYDIFLYNIRNKKKLVMKVTLDC